MDHAAGRRRLRPLALAGALAPDSVCNAHHNACAAARKADKRLDGLGAWAYVVLRFRWPIALGVLALTGVLASFIPQMEVKMASEDFLFEDDPVRAVYDEFRHDFGQDQVTIVAVSPPEIFDLTFLEKLEAFHRDLEDELPYLEEVTSLVNVRSTYGRGDELVVEDLLDEMPTTDEELAAFKAFTKDFPPELRGLAIGQSEIVRTAHNSFGRQEAFAVDEKRASEKDDEVTRAQFGAQFGAAL